MEEVFKSKVLVQFLALISSFDVPVRSQRSHVFSLPRKVSILIRYLRRRVDFNCNYSQHYRYVGVDAHNTPKQLNTHTHTGTGTHTGKQRHGHRHTQLKHISVWNKQEVLVE